ncbi:diguanylate cyclase [Sulfurifustis variabilis]|uniref:cyclic-guanylate-specific phosphodiesterase n=1 Tax=Sulfurifustis variabilis TaxID=1675686 RepID=A0A1C7AF29_9GAMM|nr:EAL domain-containing protein [Sulfurifustis variabilis]BAU49833.1 diguanylate cyclase [Sulfurifustis variabilis]
MHLVIREQEFLVAQSRQLLAGLAGHPTVPDRARTERCRRFLANTLRLHPYYTNIGVADAEGHIYCSAAPLKQGVSIADRRYFRQALETNDFSIGEYQVGRLTGKSAINMGYPVRDASDTAKAVVYAALDLSWFDQLLARIDLPPGSTLAVVDHRGTVLAYQPKSAGDRVGNELIDPALRDALFAEREGAGVFTGPDGVSRLTAHGRLHGHADGTVHVIAGIPTEFVYARVEKVLTGNLALLGLAALALVAAWVGTSLFVLRRVNALVNAAGRLGRGELGARTGLPHEGDELARLAGAFDAMAEGLERSNRALRTLSAGNRSLVRAHDEQELLAAMCRAVVRVGGYRMAWVGFAQEDDTKTVRAMAQEGLEEGILSPLNRLDVRWDDTERGRGPVGRAIRTGRPAVMREILTDPNFAPWREEAAARGYAAVAALPLIVDRRPMGALAIYAAEPDAFDENEMGLLEEMAEDLSYGIAALRTRARHEQATSIIERLAYFDTLSELPNHAQLQQYFREKVSNQDAPTALLLIDITRFREINEALGMQQANLLLKAVAGRLCAVLKPSEFIARMRGDEFAVFVPCDRVACAEQVVARIREALDERFTIGSLSLDLDTSIGVALYPEDGREVDALVRSADMALQHAKQSGAAWALYDPAHDQNTARRLALAADLREAIERGNLLLYYQPKVDVRTAKPCGVEALTRWRHPQQGMIRPDEFITLAEQTGLIAPLTEWVLETAIRQVHAWQEDGMRLPVAVNLSARNLLDATLPDKIKALCAKWGIKKGLLELEITESMIMADPARALALVTRLHKLGIPLYIDDFGTGYSSLGYLKKLPVDAIKIDKSFVLDMLMSKDSATIVRSIISLAHALGLKVVAEGVENENIWKKLQALRCDAAQGYYFGRPLALEELTGWMRERGGAVTGKRGSQRT